MTMTKTVFDAILEAAGTFGKNRIVLEDIKREPLTYGQVLTRTFILGVYCAAIRNPENTSA